MRHVLSEACEKANKEIHETGVMSLPQVITPSTGNLALLTMASAAESVLLPYMLFDPVNQFKQVCEAAGIDILYPLCSRDGVSESVIDTSIWKNGKSSRLQPRLIHDVSNPLLIVSKLYKCSNGHREIASCDPDIVKQLPEVFLDFVTSHRSGITKQLLRLCEQLLDKGLSLEAIEDMNRMCYEDFYRNSRKRTVTSIHLMKTLQNSDINMPTSSAELNQWSFAGAKLISSAIVSNFLRAEKIYRQLFSSLSAEWISCDHTYKSVTNIGYHRPSDGKWINKHKTIFIIMNEKGQPIQWKFTKTEKFDEVSDIFSQLSERFQQQKQKLSGIYTDTCCKWAGKFEDLFPGVPVKLDIFHAIQRFTSSISKKKKYHSRLARDYSLVFRDPTDLGQKRMMDTPAKEVFLKNMEKFERKWKNVKYKDGQSVISEAAWKEIKNIKIHIQKECLSGIPSGCGTNRNERVNRHLNKFLSNNRIGHHLAYARCFRLFAKLNSMNFETSKYFNNEVDSDLCRATSSKESVRIESFGINDNDLKYTDTNEKWNLNNVDEMMVRNAADQVQTLLTVKRRMKSTLTDHTYSSNMDTVDDNTEYLSLLHNAICLWSTYMQFVKKFGKKIVDYKDIGINPKVLLSAATSSSTTVSTDNVGSTENSLHRVAQTWGFDILDISGDGNCFFTSVAFQLHQLMTDTSQDLSLIVRRHFESIGLYGTQSVPKLANILRRLVVDEWTGVNRNDYQEFLTNSDVGTEAQSFLRDGHFSSALGDAMPLAMANVLHMPILILVPNTLVPFLSIFPRFNIGPISSIFLCYNNEGPGHYDALIQRKLTQNTDAEAIETYNQDKETKTQTQCGRDKDESENVFCRCGINSKKQVNHSVKNLKLRAYNLKNRCKCVLKHRKCSTRCKCSGKCGGTNCKMGIKKLEKDSPCRRQSRKRGIHEIKTTPTKYMKLSQSKDEHLNILEYFIAVAIVDYFISNGLSDKILQMISTYNKIVGIIVSEETLKWLPVANHSENNIKNAINQICKKKKEHD
mgnify:CR=1 FL=1